MQTYLPTNVLLKLQDTELMLWIRINKIKIIYVYYLHSAQGNKRFIDNYFTLTKQEHLIGI